MAKQHGQKSTYPVWAPRFWHGMRFSDWFRLVRKHRFRVHPLRWGLAATITGATVFNSSMSWMTRRRYGAQVAATTLPDDPVFIVGHWRSGTTYLHELLSCDPGFATPTTYQCFAANHFLMTESWLPRILWFLLPSRRPMDNVKTGWNAPQEDEFALCSLGAPSPYFRMAFPNEPDQCLQYLDLQELTPDGLLDWQDCLQYFLRSLTLRRNVRLILKSPTHTARVGLLVQMFPRARFLHIVRSPLSIYPSTIKLWRVLDEAQGLQRPQHHQLKSYVLTAFERMYQAFESQRTQLGTDQIYDLRYEDLVEDPVGMLRDAYERLQLGDFERVRPHVEAMAQANQRYQTNRYELDDDDVNEVMLRWSDYAQRYGYAEAP